MAHKVGLGSWVESTVDVPEAGVKAGDVGIVTAYLPDYNGPGAGVFAVSYGPGKWVTDHCNEGLFLSRVDPAAKPPDRPDGYDEAAVLSDLRSTGKYIESHPSGRYFVRIQGQPGYMRLIASSFVEGLLELGFLVQTGPTKIIAKPVIEYHE